MKPGRAGRLAAGFCALLLSACGNAPNADPQATPPAGPPAAAASQLADAIAPPTENVGSIVGSVRVLGKAPGNRVIRMSVDPKCAALTTGKLVVQEEYVANLEGDLGNVFVHLDGNIPVMKPPADPVILDQKDCVYVPRVIGAQVGQTVEFRNSDDVRHNVHASSAANQGFNIAQDRAGEVYKFQPEKPEIMLHMICDIHRWMQAWVGAVTHPYFDVTSQDGTFRIERVPAGTYTLRIWHEALGEMEQPVEVRANETATINFEYPASK